MNLNKKVSVIITTFGGSEKLRRAILSVFNQTYTNYEIIVVDDNDEKTIARKNTETIMSQFISLNNIIYIKHNKNMNGATARNTGIKNSSGDYITFLDDDDILFPQRIEKSVKFLNENNIYDGILFGVIVCNNNNKFEQIRIFNKDINYKKQLLMDTGFLGSGSNIFISRKSALDLNGFDTDFLRHQDIEFMVRFFDKYKAIGMDEILIIKSVNGINNIPDIYKMYETKILFFKKFSDLINQMTTEEIKRFYDYHYSSLLSYSFGNANLIVNKIKKELEIYRKINTKEKIFTFISNIKVRNTNIYMLIKKSYVYIKSILTNMRINHILNKEKITHIHDILSKEY